MPLTKTNLMAEYKFYTGDIVELLSYVPEKWSEKRPVDFVGNRYRLTVGPDTNSYTDPSTKKLVVYKNEYKYTLDGFGYTTPDRFMLFKRPLKNWVKFFLGK